MARKHWPMLQSGEDLTYTGSRQVTHSNIVAIMTAPCPWDIAHRFCQPCIVMEPGMHVQDTCERSLSL